ncbi:myosin-I heavy chain-like isoform X2 [Halichondria panicea]|uniref:myosin-I heavy chain-like isoform X2 n=1 Tax=Halichondria panicea TaxID=6063 RepID=UPI00312B7456
MACGEDNRFSAIYSSIEGDEYEEYVEITNGPTAYLVPNKVPPRGQSSPPPQVPSRPPARPPPTKPMPLPRGIQTLPHNAKLDKPQHKRRAGTPANKMAETPLELGRIKKGKHPPPDNLPLLDTGPNIRGKLQVGTSQSVTQSDASIVQNDPPQRLTGNKYSALSADAEVNEYASLKPLQIQRKENLRERAKRKRKMRKGNAHLQQADDSEASIYENTVQFKRENSSDNSRVVCLLLSIIIVCLVLSIGSLITAVFAITSFEHYKDRATTLSTRIVNECSVDVVRNSTLASTTVSQKCGQKDFMESKESEGNNGTQPHPLEYNGTQPHPLGYNGCSMRVTPVDTIEGSTCTATLMEESGEEPSPYCLCSCKRSQTLQFTCIITETTFEVN